MPIEKYGKDDRFVPIREDESSDLELRTSSEQEVSANRSMSAPPVASSLSSFDSSFSRVANTPASTFVRELMCLEPVRSSGKHEALGRVMLELNQALQACDDPVPHTASQNLFVDNRACVVLVRRAQNAIEKACHRATHVPPQRIAIPSALASELLQTMRTYVTAAALGRLAHLCARHDLHDETFSAYVTSLDRQVLQSAVNMAYLAGEDLYPLRLMFQLASMDPEGSADLVLHVIRVLRESSPITDDMKDLQHLALFAGVIAVLHDHVSRGDGISWLLGEGTVAEDFGMFVLTLIEEGASQGLFLPDQSNNRWWECARSLIDSICNRMGFHYTHDDHAFGLLLDQIAKKVSQSIERRATYRSGVHVTATRELL